MDGWDQATGVGQATDPFLPSEYTGLLLQAIRQLPEALPDSRAVEIGIGSGVVLANLALRGIGRLRGVDSHPAAIRAATALLDRLDLPVRVELSLGNVWEPLAGERFDLVVANLPQYPTDQPVDTERVPSWATGGPDGRQVMDPFLAGLEAHLRPGGIALITHSTIVGLARTRELLAKQGLGCTSVLATQVLLPPRKAALLAPESWTRAEQLGLLAVGPYRFIEAHVLRIARL
jgi:methylase of polypeptide subunit release factors